jgi:PAS domain S-box-containing protein
MMNNEDARELRRRAEERAAEQMRQQELPPPERLPELVHELQVHQIELEMQNEELRQAQADLEASRDRYADLYDFSPVGYVTLDESGIIREVNLTACGILGRERGRLPGHPLVAFVNSGGKDRFRGHLEHCDTLSGGEEAVVEVSVRNAEEGIETPVQIRTLALADSLSGRPYYRMAITDIRDLAEAEHRLRELNERLEQEVREQTSALEMLRDVASMANRAQSVEEALEYCLWRVAEHNGWSFGHAFLPTAGDSDLLLPAYVWYPRESERFSEFRELTLRTSLRRGDCLPGRVYATGEPAWTVDILHELGPRRLELAAALGITTTAVFPVRAGDRVVAVLEFFSEKTIEPDRVMLHSMASVGTQIGRVIERKALQDRLLTLADEEHRRIGQELHDDVGQELAGLALKSETLAEILETEGTAPVALARQIVAAVERTRNKTRRLARGLIPRDIEAPELEEALAGLARGVDAGGRPACRFRRVGDGRVSDSRTATQLYRIAQEAVSNASACHETTQVEITLRSDGDQTVLEIDDNGPGMPSTGGLKAGLGLQIMRYRAGLIGGTLSVESPPGGGTRVLCRLARKT